MEAEWSICGKVVLITGANTGIGRATALQLAKRGARRLILTCRNVKQGEEAAREIATATSLPIDNIVVRHLDLSSLRSVRKFAEQVVLNERELHVLVNNAGIFGPSKLTKSEDGFELTLATNYLGHFLLTNLLLDLLIKSAPSRIVNVSAHWLAFWSTGGFHLDDPNFEKNPQAYGSSTAYNYTKLANVLFTRELDRHLRQKKANVTTFVVHPGVVGTDIARNFPTFLQRLFKFFCKAPEQGAKCSVYCASQPSIEHLSSSYFVDCQPVEPGRYASDDEMARSLWELSSELVSKATESK